LVYIYKYINSIAIMNIKGENLVQT